MRTLAIDSASPGPSLALLLDDLLWVVPLDAGAAEALASKLNELLSEAGIAIRSVERIAVLSGPGSFTGLRAGAAFARGLARGLAVPLVSSGTFEAASLALGAPQEIDLLLGAGRGEVHVARRRGTLELLPRPVAREQALEDAERAGVGVHDLDRDPLPLSSALARLASGQTDAVSFQGATSLVYGRESAAEEKLRSA